MAAKCARMTEATAAVVESVNLVLRLTTQAAKVHAAKVRAARAAVSKVYSLLLLLLLARIVGPNSDGNTWTDGSGRSVGWREVGVDGTGRGLVVAWHMYERRVLLRRRCTHRWC
jgi:hypothetical protein